MEIGLEVAALAALPFAAAMGLGAGLAALDNAMGRKLGGWVAFLFAVAMVPSVFYFLTATFSTDFKTEIFALAPLMALIGIYVGYSLGRAAPARARASAGKRLV